MACAIGRCGGGAFDGAVSAPPVVLLHGFSQSARTWDEVVPLLAEMLPGRAIWAPEFVGHGGSDAPRDPAPYAFGELVATLAGFIDEVVAPESALVAPRPAPETVSAPVGGGATPSAERRLPRVALVGYSMGGRVALAYAAGHSDRVAALVLESAGLGPTDEAYRREAADRDATLAARVRRDSLADFMDFWETRPVFASQRALPQERRLLLREARMRNDAEALALTFEGSGQHAMPRLADAPAALAEQGVPVLYIAGELDPKYAAVARRLGEAAGGLRRGLSVHILPDVGHDAHFEDPVRYAREVGTFLNGAC